MCESPPMPLPLPLPLPGPKKPHPKPNAMPVQVRSVWAGNLEEEFALIRDFVEHHPIAAMDTEFPGVIHRPARHPRLLSPDERYALVKSNVDALHIIQLGLTLSDATGALPFVDGAPVIWEFNFCDFDLRRGDRHSPESIALLQSHGIDFEANRTFGIDSRDFGELLMSSGLVCSDSEVTWVTFHSAYDFGYLIKILTSCKLPRSIGEFLGLVRGFFGDRVIDMKHVMRQLDGLFGGLDRVAGALKVERAVGESHQAGSDSLLTWQAFLKMKKVFLLKDEETMQHAGVIYGLEDR